MPDTCVLIIAPPPLAQLLQRSICTAEQGDDIHITGVAATAAEAIALMAAEPPDILLIDLSENPAEGLQTVQTLRECNPHVIILAHVHAIDEDLILQAVRLGVMGFVTGQEDLSDALHTLRQGEPHLPPPVAGQLVRGLQRAG
jgi:two-component system, NarL family, response regulator DevR